ncbi:MAG: tetratricopeptide repeat protein [Rhodospirillales bacterium]
MKRFRHNLFSLVFALTSVTAIAGARADAAADRAAAQRYQACLALVKRLPRDAFEEASAWAALGGGAPAEHCAALSLHALGYYADAGGRLQALALKGTGGPALQAELLAQAGQSWLMADFAGKAEAAFTEAIRVRGPDATLLMDRSEARAAQENYAGALDDLNLAIELDPLRSDAFVFRASAKRLTGDTAGALEDVERALRLDLIHPEGLLERGILRRLAGDDAGARADWTKVLETAPQSGAADLARKNLERLEIGPGD